MKLALDFGNTTLKMALFDGDEMLRHERLDSADIEAMAQLLADIPFEAGIIASVIPLPDGYVSRIADGRPFYRLDHRSELPFRIDYDSPETLGPDRIAAAAGAAAMHPGKPVLVVVAGTCITFDLVTPDGTYHGGAISPGVQMRLRAMHTFTARLPLVPLTNEAGLIGKSTEGSILSGAVNGAVAEVLGTAERYRELYPGLVTVISGGDHGIFAKYQKNSIFAVPKIVLKGLNEILKHNLRHEEEPQA